MVVGALTLASLHKKLGEIGHRSEAERVAPHLLRIVGVATLPAIGGTGNLRTSRWARAPSCLTIR